MLWLLLVLSNAMAHHDTGVGQVGAASPPPTAATGTGEARLRLGLAADARWFGRTLEGTRHQTTGAGSVGAMWLLPSATVRLGSWAHLSMVVPVGTVATLAPNKHAHTEGGLGDINVRVSAERRTERLRVGGGMTLSAPTGAYTRDAAWSLTQAGVDEEGAWKVTSWDTRASLGAGAWRAGGDARASLALGPGRLVGAAAIQQPISTTTDGIRWGRDLTAAAGWRQGQKRIQLEGLVTLARHGADTIEQSATDGSTATMGGRDAAGLTLRAERESTTAWTCGGQLAMPVWQRTHGTQLVESGSLAVWVSRSLL